MVLIFIGALIMMVSWPKHIQKYTHIHIYRHTWIYIYVYVYVLI